jgi:hypothetical protein
MPFVPSMRREMSDAVSHYEWCNEIGNKNVRACAKLFVVAIVAAVSCCADFI